MSTPLYLRRGTTSQWSNSNPVLASGEIAYDTTTNSLKVGAQLQPWSNSPPAFVGNRGNPGISQSLPNKIQWFLQSTAPDGWLACNGDIVSINAYPSLENLPVLPGFSGGIGNFVNLPGGGENYGYGSGQTFASSDNSGFPQTINGVNYPRGSGPLLGLSWQVFDSSAIWGYRFLRPVVINRFAWSSYDFFSDPGFTLLQGSNDDNTYTTIAQYDLYTASRNLLVDNTTAYQYYRLNMEQNTDYFWGEISIGSLAMEGIPTPTDPFERLLPSLKPISAGASTLYPYIKL